MKTELTLTRNSVIFMACGVNLTYEWLMRKTIGISPANTWHNKTLFRKKMEKIFIALTTQGSDFVFRLFAWFFINSDKNPYSEGLNRVIIISARG